jgi:aspartyl-tRNA(Asn)/glutamyl-tRNA(Gln) amidotransferase subunit A
MAWDSIERIAKSVNAGSVSAIDNVKKAVDVLEKSSDYNVVISYLKESALARAKTIDSLVKDGKNAGKLAGVPFVAKDNFLVLGAPTTAASNILKNFEAPYQSTAIEKLEAEGAICVAKVNLDSFAHGSSTENSAFGPTKNPHNSKKVPGGSSGGSAAAVALGAVPFALGTDTGGSIRLPASFCGVVGLKPTYGLVSRYGVVAMASSTDVIGPFANNVNDASVVLDVIAGRDVHDGTTIDRSPSYTSSHSEVRGKRVAVIKEYFSEGLDESVKKQVQTAIETIKKQGAVVEEISVPSINLALACYYVIVPAEISSNLSRYDGQRYGLSSPDAKDLNEVYEHTRQNGFMAENKRRIMIGTYVLSSGYYDAYYKKAQIVRTKLINEFADIFDKYDFVVGPTAPTTAFDLGQNTKDPLAMYLADIMTVAVNLVGIPALSIPVGLAGGMPVGLQIMAPQRADKALLDFAAAVEGEIA